MRIITFNVNGIRSICQKNKAGNKDKKKNEKDCLQELIDTEYPDILCLQEIKTQSLDDVTIVGMDKLPYVFIHPCTRKKGYSGVALLSRIQPEWVSYGFDLFHENRIGTYEDWEVDKEGRLLCAKFSNVIVITVYVPNAQPELARMGDRARWDRLLRQYSNALQEEFGLPVILCGDFNIAPTDDDIHRKQPKKTPGASEEERNGFQAYLTDGWIDAYRKMHPDNAGYTYWSNFRQSRIKNNGWRIDLFLISPPLFPQINKVNVLPDYWGSDHAPVLLDVSIND